MSGHLLYFSENLATVKDPAGIKWVLKQSLKQLLDVSEYIITIRNPDNASYGYFLHDLPVEDPTDEGFRIITGPKMSIAGTMTKAVLKSERPVVFSVIENIRTEKYFFPSRSFWRAAGAERILGTRLRVAQEDVGILWIQPGKTGDRLLKGVSAQIAIALSNVFATARLEEHQKGNDPLKQDKYPHLSHNAQSQFRTSDLIGSSPAMRQVTGNISTVARTSSTVLILGETGTGKELAAKAIHANSPRKDQPFVKVNCAALPTALVESELFGHEKGSFTGAIDQKIGKFQLADRGTLFLDEIAEIPTELQSKLLRAIQEKDIERIGGHSVIPVNVRIVAATNRYLPEEVNAGRFRADLFHRLNVFPIEMPPLRNRPGDIPALAASFLAILSRRLDKTIEGLSPDAMQQLMCHSWPGNVRELENTLERSVLLSASPVITRIHFTTTGCARLPTTGDNEKLLTLDENERHHIIRVLQTCRGKISGPGGAAAILDTHPSTLKSRMQKLGIKKSILH